MKRKKVLITTVQKAPNFGASLQAYALWKYISGLGHECKIIDLLRPYHSGYIPTQGFEPFCKKERSWWLNFRIDYIRPLRKNVRNLLYVFTSLFEYSLIFSTLTKLYYIIAQFFTKKMLS